MKRLKNLVLIKSAIVFLAFLFTTVNLFAFQPDTSDLKIRLEKALESYQVPGMAVAVVKNNEVIFASGFGVTDISTGQKVDENTLFGIASNTKAMTAAGLAVLVDEGKLKWNDRVQRYIPWFELYNPYVTSELNIVDILTHRAGFRTFSVDLVW